MTLHVTVFSYPDASARLERTVRELDSLVSMLTGKYLINSGIEIHNASDVNRPFADFLMRFLASCAQKHGYFDLYWLVCLRQIIKEPTPHGLEAAEVSCGSSDFLKLFFREAKERSTCLGPVPSALSVALEGLELKPGQGPWGACYSEYPEAVAVETMGTRNQSSMNSSTCLGYLRDMINTQKGH